MCACVCARGKIASWSTEVLLRNLRIINLLNGCVMMVIAVLVIVLQFVAFNLTTITICLYIA